MIAARQELDLRPQLERLDRLITRSEDLDPAALTFTFRPLWQLDAPSQAALALSKAQATQIYAGLKLWPAAVTARLVEAQLVADGTYPNAAVVFGKSGVAEVGDAETTDASWAGAGALSYLTEPRDWHGRWTESAFGVNSVTTQVVVTGTSEAPPTSRPHVRPQGSLGQINLTQAHGYGQQSVVYPEGWLECHEKRLAETEHIRGGDRSGLYRRCVRQCLGGADADY